MTSIYIYQARLRCGCMATFRETFAGSEIHTEKLTPDHDALVDRYRATPPWKREGLADPCGQAAGE